MKYNSSAQTGFYSCKTGIHTIHGDNLGTALKARIQDRHRNLQPLCGGTLKIIASIENPAVIQRILEHLENRTESRSEKSREKGSEPIGLK